jgi:hypothetical protein
MNHFVEMTLVVRPPGKEHRRKSKRWFYSLGDVSEFHSRSFSLSTLARLREILRP